MKKKRERAKWICLILCCLNFLLCVVPPVLDLLLPKAPDQLVFLSPAWLAALLLLYIFEFLNPMLILMVEYDPIIEAVNTFLPIFVCLLSVLPIIGWLRVNRGKRGRGLIQVPLVGELLLAACTMAAMLFFSVPLLTYRVVGFWPMIAYGLAGVVLPIVIFRYLYIWQ